jgi:uncharacterized protein involved in exopolysaccharide biosynthesis
VTKAEQVHAAVEQLTAQGARKADAFRQVADEYGQPLNSIRGAYYSAARPAGSGRQRGPKRTSAEAAIESAVIALNRAIADIDAELETAKQRIEQAKTDYEQLKNTAPERKALIQTKIEALTS